MSTSLENIIQFCSLENINGEINILQEHPVIQHTVDPATTQIMPACTRRSMVRHLRRIPTCTEDMPLLLRIPLITIRRSRILRHPIPIIRSCRIRIRICPASHNHPLSREATWLRIILGWWTRESRRKNSKRLRSLIDWSCKTHWCKYLVRNIEILRGCLMAGIRVLRNTDM